MSLYITQFDVFMESALYGTRGFYASGRGAGRRGGDFLTSPEVGPLFGRLVARLADRCWEQSGRPERFTLLDVGAGRGTLARSVLAARPACAPALRYMLVERSSALRLEHGPLLERPPGPCAAVESVPDLPTAPFEGLVVANELLDNLPVRLLERTADGWAEVCVAISADGDGVSGLPARATVEPGLPQPAVSGRSGGVAEPTGPPPGPVPFIDWPASPSETLAPVGDELTDRADSFAPSAPSGGRLPLADAAVAWVGRALDLLWRGRLVVFDYTDSSASLAARPAPEWLRTYRDGVRGHDPLASPGSADITCEVPLDQVLAAHPGAEVCDQAEFLRRLGIDDLVAEGRATWAERAAVGDLAAMEARSRIGEAEALCDPGGLGAFTVATWTVA